MIETLKLLVVLVCLGVGYCVSPPLSNEALQQLPESTRLAILRDRNRTLPLHQPQLRMSFKLWYISHEGHITRYHAPNTVKLWGTLGVSDSIMMKGAKTIAAIVRHMPYSIFEHLTLRNGAGLFTQVETLAVYPEFSYLNIPGCETSCYGACARTCGSDGRKLATIAGLTSHDPFSMALSENVDCAINDPYSHQENVLAHEFTHYVKFSLPTYMQQQITQAYNHAKMYTIWIANSYALSSEDEYWAEASSAFFGAVTRQDGPPGGMDQCNFAYPCPNEMTNRDWLKRQDPMLFNILQLAYTGNQAHLPSGMRICF